MTSFALEILSSPFALLGLALLLDMRLGEPAFLWSHLPHPVVLFGKAITILEKRLNRRRVSGRMRRVFGVIAVIIWISLALSVGYFITIALSSLPALFGLIIELMLVAILLAGRSLYDHIKAVADPLRNGDIDQARFAVSMIVGRDTSQLGEADIARAAIETGAENLSDGVIAPAFWYLIGGLPLLITYKMINTADSMVGYKSARFFAFGWGAAISDDIVNFVPARLSAYLIILVAFLSGKSQKAYQVMRDDAANHASPNAGYPESAMAGMLDIRLGGSRYYQGRMLALPAMNDTGREAIGAADIDDALSVLWRTLCLAVVICLLIVTWLSISMV